MFDFLDDIDWGGLADEYVAPVVDTIGNAVSDVGSAIGDGVGAIGDYGSGLVDLVGNYNLDDLLQNADLSAYVDDFELPSFSFGEVTEPSADNFLSTALQSTPDTTYDISQGLDINPVATEAAWKAIMQNPMASISPQDYSMSSPTILDKLLSQGTIGSSEISKPSDWFNPLDWMGGTGEAAPIQAPEDYGFYGRSRVTNPEEYKPEGNWLKKLLERPTNSAGEVVGKSLAGKILGTALGAGQVYGALNAGKMNTDKRNNMKASISQIPTKRMTWVTPQRRASGGPIEANSVPPWMEKTGARFIPPSPRVQPFLAPGPGALGLLRSASSGQSDQIPVTASGGEYIFDADTVSALGDGNTEAGARKLDEMRENIRRQKRAAPVNQIPPKAKRPEQYLKGAK